MIPPTNTLTRRHFLGVAALGTAAVPQLVSGAGPAGVSAAITAARAGAKVRLFEWRGCVGGVWTAGLLGWLIDFEKPGFSREITSRLSARGLRRGTSVKNFTYEPEGMKLLLEELLVESGVKFQFHTRVAAAYRDTRRIAGRYTVNTADVTTGARHDDAVVRPTFSIDIHALSAEHNKTAGYSNRGLKVKPYDIPLRALIAKDVDGLMMAGRCISGDFIAHSSYRVTGNAVAMGEAAGAFSAGAAKSRAPAARGGVERGRLRVKESHATRVN
jgi:FAD dependent oxidoreductase